MILEHVVSKADLQVYALMTISFLHLWNRNLGREAENLEKVLRVDEAYDPKACMRARSHESSLKHEGESRGTNPFALLFRFILFLAFLHKQGWSKDSSIISWTRNKGPVTGSRCGRLQNGWQMLFLSVLTDPGLVDSTSQTGCPPKSGYASPTSPKPSRSKTTICSLPAESDRDGGLRAGC